MSRGLGDVYKRQIQGRDGRTARSERKKRKKTDNPREGWEDGTPPPHRDFKERCVVRCCAREYVRKFFLEGRDNLPRAGFRLLPG